MKKVLGFSLVCLLWALSGYTLTVSNPYLPLSETGFFSECAGGPVYTIDSVEEISRVLQEAFSQRQTEFVINLNSRPPEDLPFLVQQDIDGLFCEDPYDYLHFSKIRWSWISYGETTELDFQISYLTSAAQEAQLDQGISQLLQDFQGLSAADQIRAVHDWIVQHVSYDLTFSRYTAYDAFFARQAVCEGYALLAYKMLTDLGFKAMIVLGVAASSLNYDVNGDGKIDEKDNLHAWNMVRLCCGKDCQYFHLDVSWDDPIPDGQLRYDYFLVSDATISRDHQVTQNCHLSAPQDFESWASACPYPITKNPVSSEPSSENASGGEPTGGSECTGACHTGDQEGGLECGPDHPELCATREDCLAAGGHWCEGVCSLEECPSHEVEPPPSGKGRMGFVDPLHNPHLSLDPSTGKLHIHFHYAQPVYLFVGMISCDFRQIKWLNCQGDTCSFNDWPSLAKTSVLDVDDLPKPLESGFLFWLVVNTEDFFTYDWKTNYDLEMAPLGCGLSGQ